MERSVVCLMPVQDYDAENVFSMIEKGTELLGGLGQFIRPGEKVLVKPNLLSGAVPEKAVSTHPAVFGGVLRLLRKHGFENVTYGDGPGSGTAAKIVDISGLAAEAEKYGVPLAPFSESITVDFPRGRAAKKFVLAKDVVGADALISVSKMKTHALENLTGALKNQYGCVFGKNKALGHAQYPNSRVFADMIADLNACVRPRLFIMDGIVAMEGNGPASGRPKPMRVLLLSADPVALDTVFARLVYLEPAFVPTTVSGAAAGLGTMDESLIDVRTPEGDITVSEAQRRYGDPTFDVVRKKTFFWRLRPIIGMILPAKDRPVVDLGKCIACGVCEKACPVEGKAVHSGNGKKARYDYKKCIRCYCCQEMCPARAITKKG